MIAVYAITHKSGKQYIGSSAELHKRWVRHKWELNTKVHHAKKLQRSWNKYGEGEFAFSVIEEVNADSLVEREQFWMDTFKPFFNSSLIAGGGCHGYSHTQEARRRIGLASSNRVRSPETRKKMSEARKAYFANKTAYEDR